MDKDIFDLVVEDLQEKTFNQIKLEWGYSTVMLKNYLNRYDATYIRGYAEDLMDIKVNRLLPYTNNKRYMLYGDYAIYRLGLAIKAKATIMLLLGDLDDEYGMTKYINECLHLFLRIDSTRTLDLNFKRFSDMVIDTCNEVKSAYNNESNWSTLINELLDLSNFYKSKRVSVKYHYTLEDFESIKGCNSWSEAYELWCNNVFPYLLDNYKNKVLNEYKQHLQIRKLEGKQITNEYYQELITKKQAELDKVTIHKPIDVKRFQTLIYRLKNRINKYK